LPPISKTAIARPRQERFYLPPGAIRDLTGLADPGYYADYLCQTKSKLQELLAWRARTVPVSSMLPLTLISMGWEPLGPDARIASSP
jgi:hypothetical protein